jgi:hypothetical protein
MPQDVVQIAWLPSAALDSATEFHEGWLDEVLGVLETGAQELAIVLPAAPRDHDDWRRALVRDLAREWAPQRVNIVAGDDEQAVAATLAYLSQAPGVTGQLLLTSSQSERSGAG